MTTSLALVMCKSFNLLNVIVRLAWSKRRRPPGAVLYSSREPSELSQWLCHDGSTINIVVVIIIIIIIVVVVVVILSYVRRLRFVGDMWQ